MKHLSSLTMSMTITTVISLSIIINACGDETLNFIGSSQDASVSTNPNNQSDSINQSENESDLNSNKNHSDSFSKEDQPEPGLEDELSQYLIHLDQKRTNTPSQGASVLQDVVGHYFSGPGCLSYTNYYSSDPDTYSHEATHGLNACIRNNYNPNQEHLNGFYLLEGKAIVITEPRVKKSQVAGFVPKGLQSLDLTKRFNTYIIGQSSFENDPLYIFDEWNAYINGALESIEQFKTKNYKTNSVLLGAGATEFMVYATSLGLAISKLDPSYFTQEPKFIPLYKHLVEKTVIRILQEGSSYSQVVDPSMVAYFNKFRTSAESEDLRNFIRTYMGTGWAKKILGI